MKPGGFCFTNQEPLDFGHLCSRGLELCFDGRAAIPLMLLKTILFFFGLSSAGVYAEVSSNGLCPLFFRLELTVKKEGFHRTADYYLELFSKEETAKCRICIKQTLPNSLFANKDEIIELVRLKMIAASVAGSVDVEAAADVSTPHEVYLFTELASRDFNGMNATISLPFHTRYHRARKDGGFEEATLPRPEVLITCDYLPENCMEQSTPQTCPAGGAQENYVPVNYLMVDKSEEILIPVGNSSHYEIVQLFTFIVTWAGNIAAVPQGCTIFPIRN